MTNAETLFNKIDGDPSQRETVLRNLFAAEEVENEFLDYKGAEKIDDKSTKLHWSKSLSAFANTQGGVLIWGIDCRKPKGGEIDGPKTWSLTPNAKSFAEKLQDFLIGATTDLIEGVIVRPVPFGTGDSGCVVCFIPEGKNKPYVANYADEHYYQRVGNRSPQIPHSLLRSLFHPRIQPVIDFDIRFNLDSQPRSPVKLKFDFMLSNTGNGSAKNLLVRVMSFTAVTNSWRNKELWHLQMEASISGKHRFGMRAMQPIHPMQGCHLMTLDWESQYEGTDVRTTKLEFIIDSFADDMEPRRLTKMLEYSHFYTGSGEVSADAIPFNTTDMRLRLLR